MVPRRLIRARTASPSPASRELEVARAIAYRRARARRTPPPAPPSRWASASASRGARVDGARPARARRNRRGRFPRAGPLPGLREGARRSARPRRARAASGAAAGFPAPVAFRRRTGRTYARSGSAPADRAVEGDLSAAHLEPVPRVDGLDVEHLSTGEAQHPLHRRRHVLVHPVGELDDDDGALAGCTDEPPDHGSRPTPELAEHNLHSVILAWRPSPGTSCTRSIFANVAAPPEAVPAARSAAFAREARPSFHTRLPADTM